MKYIRTKDEIIEYQSGFYKTDIVCGKDSFIFKDEIIKQADTIEELCDEFVLTDNGNTPLIIHNVVELDSEIFENVKTLKTQYKVIYGAIWTEKGLIYVAKMNDKGELELL